MSSNKRKIFSQALDRCACLQPGGTVELSVEAEAVLLQAIRSFEEHVDRPGREYQKSRMPPHMQRKMEEARLERELRQRLD